MHRRPRRPRPLLPAAIASALVVSGALAQDASPTRAPEMDPDAAPEYVEPDALISPETLETHDALLTLDTHVDIGAGFATRRLDPGVNNRAQVNLPGMWAGGLDAGFFIVYTPQGALDEDGYAAAEAAAEDKYRGIVRMLRGYRQLIALAVTADEVESIVEGGRLVALIGIENAYPLGTTAEEVVERVAMWADRGARYASITHFGHNQFGGSSNPSEARGDGEDPGLTELGRTLVEALNEHGLMVDVSHVGPRTASDAIALSRAPVIASHSTAKAVYDNPRGLSDEQLRAIRDDGGVAQITAFRSYLAPVDESIGEAVDALGERLGLESRDDFAAASVATLDEYYAERRRLREAGRDVNLDQYLDHVMHAIEVAGIDHVGLSGDFDGGGGVEGWDGAEESPNVTAALLDRGLSSEDLEKVWGGNLLRVMREVEAAAGAR